MKVEPIKNDCAMCAPYARPGWIVNANDWLRCFDCNPTKRVKRPPTDLWKRPTVIATVRAMEKKR